MSQRKRRIRSPHPGVVIKQRTLPSGHVAYRALFTDPDSQKDVYTTLDLIALPTREARRQWAIAKSKELASRRMDLQAGVVRVEASSLGTAIDDFLKAAVHRLRPNTLRSYKLTLEEFRAWADKNSVRTNLDVTRARLTAFRDHLLARPPRGAKSGGKRGEHKNLRRKRSLFSVKRELGTMKTVLNALRSAGLLPTLDREAISDTLKTVRTPVHQPSYLEPTKLEELLQACLRYDAATFDETREEHARLRAKGSTFRYQPIAAFSALVLLTGCRRGEALSLKWSDVDLNAKDHEGRTVGEIRLRAEATKTQRARTVGLEVSPGLRKMLSALKLRAGNALYVFGGEQPYTADSVEAARARLVSDYGAPEFSWQVLRSTCATYLTNAPSIFGAATVFLSARQLGHSVAVAEKHYLGVHRGIGKAAQSLEAAMQLESVLSSVIDAQNGPARRRPIVLRKGGNG